NVSVQRDDDPWLRPRIGGFKLLSHGASLVTGTNAGTHTIRRAAPWTDAAILALGSLLLYAMLGEWTWYKIDGQITILRLAEGGPGHPRHLLADEILRLFLAWIRPLGLSTYAGVRLFSAVTAAAAGFVVHRCTARLGVSRARCAVAQAAFAATPSLVFYASIVEFHAPLLFFASLAFYATTRLGSSNRHGVGSALLAASSGVLSGFAYLQHASGQFLPALLVPWLVVLLRDGGRTSGRDLRKQLEPTSISARPWLPSIVLPAVLVAFHFAITKGVPFAIRHYDLLPRFAPLAPTDASAFGYVAWHFESLTLAEFRFVPITLTLEWIVPFLPLSVLAWFSGPRKPRGARRALAIALVPYLGISFLLMRHENEFGAYTMPCVLLATVLAAWSCPPRLLVIATLVTLFASTVHVRLHDAQSSGLQLARSLESRNLESRIVLLVAGETERDDALMALPNRDFAQYLWLEPLQDGVTPELLRSWLVDQEKHERRVLATARTVTWLESVERLRGVYTTEDARLPELPGARWIVAR
ncbi:MAG: phospholipid carrier-dependent glycosyltransferase, partial [Planctomycetes bacterium]|nr:phospholipid carrier-dependent glycosyltransferase [Planctomycetota bacterium]